MCPFCLSNGSGDIMGTSLRIFLILSAVLALVVIVCKIRKTEIQISDSVFWFFFLGSFVLFAIFPQVAHAFSDFFGFDATSNFIFFYAVGSLIIRNFTLTLQIARIRSRFTLLVQQLALQDKRDD